MGKDNSKYSFFSYQLQKRAKEISFFILKLICIRINCTFKRLIANGYLSPYHFQVQRLFLPSVIYLSENLPEK